MDGNTGWNFDQNERSTLTSSVHLFHLHPPPSAPVHRMLRILRPLATRLSLGRRMSSAVASPSIQLTPEEARFCDLLDDFAREGRKRITKPEVEVEIPEVECRIAGGWVRDKVCSKYFPSRLLLTDRNSASWSAIVRPRYHPLNMRRLPIRRCLYPVPDNSAARPAHLHSLHWKSQCQPGPEQAPRDGNDEYYGSGMRFRAAAKRGLRRRESDPYRDCKSHALQSGPSLTLSFQRIGTPEEDALRRDITINTLFYNVHTRLVEDHTHLGLSDLSQKLIRTPLEPLQTFRDDPLRVLRSIRFASRFGYTLVDDVVAAIKNAEILDALRTRISRERVGIELEKMLKGPDPHESITLIDVLDLYPHIFSVNPTTVLAPSSAPLAEDVTETPAYCPAPHATSESRLAADTLRALLPSGSLAPHLHPTLHSHLVTFDSASKSRAKHLWLACALVPCRGGIVKEKKKEIPLTEAVIREGLKVSPLHICVIRS